MDFVTRNTLNVDWHSDTNQPISVKLCMIIDITKLYSLLAVSKTLTFI